MDNIDPSRMARDMLTVENVGDAPMILEHENIGATEHGYDVEAGDSQVGDVFLGPNVELTLAETWRIDYPEGIAVYKFSVEHDHNDFVIANHDACKNGVSPLLVHNALDIIVGPCRPTGGMVFVALDVRS